MQTGNTTPTTKGRKTHIQQIVGTLLYYAKAVDPTMLVALGSISDNQAKINEIITQTIKQMLDYGATHPNYTIRAKESDMVLHVLSDRSYLSESQAQSQAGGHLFLGYQNFDQRDNNCAIITISQIIENVMASASETECADLFINTTESIVLLTTLENMGYPQ